MLVFSCIPIIHIQKMPRLNLLNLSKPMMYFDGQQIGLSLLIPQFLQLSLGQHMTTEEEEIIIICTAEQIIPEHIHMAHNMISPSLFIFDANCWLPQWLAAFLEGYRTIKFFWVWNKEKIGTAMEANTKVDSFRNCSGHPLQFRICVCTKYPLWTD